MTVLLVDDDPDIRLIASMALEKIGGHRVLVAEDGAAALSSLAKERPDVILTDYMLPDIAGPELLRAIRDASAPDTPPVVFLTAKDDPGTRDRLLAAGARGLIPKPFDPLNLPHLLTTQIGTDLFNGSQPG